MNKLPKRSRVLLKLSCVFAAGWLLALLLFPDRALLAPVCPVLMGTQFLRGDYDMAAMCFGATILMLASVTFSVLSLRLLRVAYVMIALFWLWVYCLLAIPF